jgi:PAS domain S-box-containing protein
MNAQINFNKMERFLEDKEFLMNVLETMNEGLMVVDKDGNILFFNRSAEEMTGYKREDVIGHQCMILDTDTCIITTDAGKQKKCALFETGKVMKRKCSIRAKNGRLVRLVKNAVALKNKSGEIIGGVEIMSDVTSLYIKEMEIERLKTTLGKDYGFMGLIGNSHPMQRLYEQIQNAARSEAPVIIYGESGTGKELVANAIHELSRRSKNPFVKINCGSFNESLLESELFGHVKGSFTGALRDRQGRFESANNGSIFLDEIGDMPPSMQIKLLRTLEEKLIERVGDNKPISVDVRVISATNKDLCSLVDSGHFREDLFYRINVIPICTPPLRKKIEDIPLIASHFMGRISLINQKNIQRISPEAIEVLMAYDWPGNVRQFINTLEYAAVTSKNETIDTPDLPDYVFKKTDKFPIPQNAHKKSEYVLNALSIHNWNRTLTAKYMGISRVTLWKLMKQLNIKEDSFS